MYRLAQLLTSAAVSLAAAFTESAAQAQDATRRFVLHDAPVLALEHVQVIDGTGAPALADRTILIEGGRIRSIAPSGQAVIPAGATRLDLSGHTVIPGLVMLHEHLNYFSGHSVWDTHPVSYPRLYLAAGVTTIRTAGSESPQVDLNVKRRIDAGQLAGPRIHVTGPFLNGTAMSFLGDYTVDDAAGARAVVAFWADRGATSFKAYTGIGMPALAAAIEEAHRRGLQVIGHLESVSCADAAAAGIDAIEHSFASCLSDLGMKPGQDSLALDGTSPAVRNLIRQLVATGTALTATPMGAVRVPIPDDERGYLSVDERARYEATIADPPPFLPSPAHERTFRQLERTFVAAGGRLALGSDPSDFGRIAGFANQRVLEEMVYAGFTPLEVLRMATRDGASLLGVGHEIGTIAPGMYADLVVLRRDPSNDIHAVRDVRMVFKGGVAYDAAALRESVRGMVGRH